MSNLAINKDVYFDCARKQLAYDITDDVGTYRSSAKVNRYAIVRKDTGDVLGIHTDDYIVRPYATLAEGVNKIIEDKNYLNSILMNGSEKASTIARKTLSKVYRKVGFVKK